MNKTMIVLLVLIIILASLVLAIVIITKKISDKISRFSRAAFGTSSLLEGVEQMQREYATTPKSVSGMTSLYLPKIAKDFPDFHYDEMKERAQNVLCSFLLAIDTRNVGALKDANTELKNQLENHIVTLKGSGLREHFKELKIHRTEISNYHKKEGRCTITFQSSIQYYHYVLDEEGKIKDGSRDTLFQSKYDVDLIYIQDRDLVEQDLDGTLALNCPNCGAPLKGVGAKNCEYCGSPVIEFNIHAWSFSAIRERG